MNEIITLSPKDFPERLREITDPPEKLYLRGTFPDDPDLKWLCVVGSRKYSQYGRRVCEKLVSGLRGYPIVIVSGLALGMDGIAHAVALDTGLSAVAVPGSGLDEKVLHPRTNFLLAKRILEQNGCLLSEYEPNFKATVWSFPKRNRIMVGLSDAVLVVEAEEKSGTLITARLATEYNRDVLAVPGPIDSPNAIGTNALIKDGATPITSSADILETFELNSQQTTSDQQLKNLSENEKKVLELLREPTTRDELVRALDMPIHEAQTLLSAMEIKGMITEELGSIRIK